MTDTTDVTGDGPGRLRPHRAGRHPERDAAQLHRLRDVGDRRPRAARRSRRPEARPPQDPVRHVRLGLPAGSQLRQVRPRRRRRDGQLPPARRQRAVRRAGAHGAALVAALPDDRPAGQLRVARQRPGCCLPLHRMSPAEPRDGDAARHRQGNRRLRPELRGQHRRAGHPPCPDSEPAGQRFRRHRGRHGHPHPAAQPARGRGRRHLGARSPGRDATRSCSKS